ncbi:MAG TPA: hypothetical protein PKC72_00915 [Chitinophagaceae bacterium]|nr:hypothetical protein [Chitinophagaceae bacterium]
MIQDISYHGFYLYFRYVISGNYSLKISESCSEDWDAMSIAGTNRHCHLCNKEVIDFSILTNDQIKDFFLKNTGQSTCGRFRKNQIERISIQLPSGFFKKKIPAWQKYLAVFLICFGSHLYSLDISVDSKLPSLYAQTKNSSQKSKKRKKKLRNKKNIRTDEIAILPIDLKDFIMGLTIIIPENPAISIIPVCQSQNDSTEASVNNLSDYSASLTVPKDDKKRKKKENPFQKMEFIIPATLRIRSPKKHKKR